MFIELTEHQAETKIAFDRESIAVVEFYKDDRTIIHLKNGKTFKVTEKYQYILDKINSN